MPEHAGHATAGAVPAAESGVGPAPELGPRRARREAQRTAKAAERRSAAREIPILAVVAIVLALLVKTFLLQAFSIPSGSMENTLLVGDRILVEKVGYRFGDISRGDVVVFDGADSFTPEVTVAEPQGPIGSALRWVGQALGLQADERDFVKRVIGVGGDRVQCCDASGRLTVNGVPLDEPYLYPGDVPSRDSFDVVVPAGKLWVMGDHRSISQDSRARLGAPGGGFVPEDRVIGRAFAVVWPFSRFEGLGRPESFDDPALDANQGQQAAP